VTIHKKHFKTEQDKHIKISNVNLFKKTIKKKQRCHTVTQKK